MGSRVMHDEVRLFKVSDLNQDTAGVLQQINDSGRPAVITKHGRFIAMITPLEGRNVEGLLVDAVMKQAALDDEAEPMSTERLAKELGVTLPS